MLQAINDRIKGWLGITIVILIGLPFALWGIQSYFDDSGPRYAAKVNNVEISENEFERTVSAQRQALVRQNNGVLPMEEKTLRERTLAQLINQRLLESVTLENDYRISDLVLSAKLQQLFSVDGVFDRDRLESVAMSNRMSVPMYEHTLRNELRLQQMQSAIANSAFVTKEEVNDLALLKEQTRDISVLTFNQEGFSSNTSVTAESIKQYYEENVQRFMLPEKVKVDYVEISSESLTENVEASEEQITSMYDDYLASVSGREERQASHVLLSASDDKAAALKKIESLKQEIEQGADFSEIAKKHSQDPGSAAQGGDLGWIALGEMVKPFEQALFDMEKGAVSEIVESQFGYHLIKLSDIRSETVIPLGVKRYEFEDELKSDAVASMFYDVSERLASTAYENPDSLDMVVDALELKVQTSDFFTRGEGKGVAENQKVRDIAFSSLVLEQGSNSDVIEISPTHVIVLRINEHVPAKPIPLEVVSSKIENILKTQAANKQAAAVALEVKAKIEAGEPVDSLLTEGVSMQTFTALKREDTTKVGDPMIIFNAFKMIQVDEVKVSVKKVELMTGGVALVVLNKVNMPDTVSPSQLELVKSEVSREKAMRDFSSAVLAIQKDADIDKNIRLTD